MADVDIEASPDGLAHDFLLILRLGPIEDHAPPAATPPRQGHGNDFVHLLGREFAVSSTISRTRLAPRRFRMRLMVDDTANSLPSRWTKSFPCPCLGGVAAGGAWSSIGPSRNISRKSCARPSGDASISTSAIVRSATNECKGAIRDRPLTL